MITKENILALDLRSKIYKFIDKHPGLNLRELSRRTNIPKTTLTYHLRYLKKQGLIKMVSEGEYKRVYTKDKMGAQDKQILSLMRQKIPCRIFLYLIFKLSFSQIEVSKELDVHPATVAYHLKKMMDMDIIEEATVRDDRVYPFPNPENPVYIKRKPVGTEKFYRRKNQRILEATYRVLITHKHSLPDEKYIDAYIDYLKGIMELKKMSNENRTKKMSDDRSFIESFLDIFKPPFAT